MVEQNRVNSASLTHPGRKRSNNEDYVTYFEPDDQDDLKNSGCLYIVADGVGGSSFGERASKYAAEKVSFEYYQHPDVEPGERLSMAMRKACHEIFTFADESEHLMRMATTMVACVILGDQLTIANVGDSRAYLFRDGVLQQLTRDHSIVGEMVRDGEMTEEESMRSKIKNRITRSLGGDDDVKVDIFHNTLEPGDRLLLCTDGITRYATPADLHGLLNRSTPDETARVLVDFANHEGGADNSSVIVVDYLSPQATVNELATVHGQPPRNIDWESLKTDAGNRKTQRPHRKSKSIENRIWLIGGVIVFLLVVVLISMILYVMGEYSGAAGMPATTENKETVGFLSTQTIDPVIPTVMPTVEQTVKPAEAIIEETQNTLLAAGDTIPPIPQLPTKIPDKSGNYFCVIKTESGDTLSSLLFIYGLVHVEGNKYSRFETCTPDIKMIVDWECMLIKSIDDPDKILSNQYFIIPNIVDQTHCQIIDGKRSGKWSIEVP